MNYYETSQNLRDLIPFLVEIPTLLFVSKYWNEYAIKKLLQSVAKLIQKGELTSSEETFHQNIPNHIITNLFNEFKKVPEKFFVTINRSDRVGLEIIITGRYKSQQDMFAISFHKKKKVN